MAEKYFKKYSTSLTIREMQIKSTLRFHLAPVRMAKINITNNSSCWQEGEEGENEFIAGRSANLHHCGNQCSNFSGT